MRLAGESVLTLRPIQVKPANLGKKSKGVIAVCPLCAEAYPARHGAICLGCQGEAPVQEAWGGSRDAAGGLPDGYSGKIAPELAGDGPRLVAVPVEQAVGKTALHDMTRIEPGQSKGPEFHRGQVLTAGDVCRLQHMGRHNVYVAYEGGEGGEAVGGDSAWVHEDDAARAFALALGGEGTVPAGAPREGKVKLKAALGGLLVVDEARLEAFNLVPDVMAATLHGYTLVGQGQEIGGTRAVPLHLSRPGFEKAMAVLRADGVPAPVLEVRPLRAARVGILVTGTEVFQGLIEDKFIPIVSRKVEALGCSVAGAIIRPDDKEAIRSGVAELLAAGADLIVTTAGLSVDPDDVTRTALAEAGVEDMLYGMPLLPGTMTLLGRIRGNGGNGVAGGNGSNGNGGTGNGPGQVQVLGIPACALFFKTTSLDLLLPRLLAGLEITRRDLARLGHGGYCLNCPACTYPHCPFGK
jgi:formylmethanofuran dehydrogenase subunit E